MQVLLRALCPPLPGTEPVGGWALPTEEQGAWSAKLTLPGSLPQQLPSPQPSRKLSISQAVRPSGWRGQDTGWREALGARSAGQGRGERGGVSFPNQEEVAAEAWGEDVGWRL